MISNRINIMKYSINALSVEMQYHRGLRNIIGMLWLLRVEITEKYHWVSSTFYAIQWWPL